MLCCVHRCIFTLFIAGFTALIKKSGGLAAITKELSGTKTCSSRNGQLAVFAAGLVVFFDEYGSILVIGKLLTPVMHLFSISREKLAFLVQAIAVPVSSINPFTIWAGFEVGLIQAEIDKLTERQGGSDDDFSITSDGSTAYLRSIAYRYYPILMLCLILILIVTERDWGPMLVAERKTRAFQRQDGGDSLFLKGLQRPTINANHEPAADTPMRFWNMVFPLVALVFFFFLVFAVSVHGDDGPEYETYSALVISVASAILVTQAFYSLQFKKPGRELVWFFPHRRQGDWIWFVSLESSKQSEGEKLDIETSTKGGDSAMALREILEANNSSDNIDALRELLETNSTASATSTYPTPAPKPLLGLNEGTGTFVAGMEDVYPVLMLLTLAWAYGSSITAVGIDRFLARIIMSDSIDASSLPTLSFIASVLLAFSTGSSRGTMAIMMPVVMVPAYEASGGNPDIFYGTIGAICSGAVAGDHLTPLSATTILTCFATECEMKAHFWTQLPYGILVMLLSIFFGTLPVGYGAYSSAIAYLCSVVGVIFFVYVLCAPILDPKGRFDFFTERQLQRNGDPELQQLKLQTIDACKIDQLVRNQANEEKDTSRAEKPAFDYDTDREETDEESVKNVEEDSKSRQHLDVVHEEIEESKLRLEEYPVNIGEVVQENLESVEHASGIAAGPEMDSFNSTFSSTGVEVEVAASIDSLNEFMKGQAPTFASNDDASSTDGESSSISESKSSYSTEEIMNGISSISSTRSFSGCGFSLP